jgi:Cu+-exporting ATPase
VTEIPATTVEAIRFPVAGMTCSSCVNRISRAVRRLAGVTKISIDLRTETATVRREPALVSNAALAAAIADAGYTADLASAIVVPHDERPGLLGSILRWAGR